jgi:hypothetical protein
MKVDRFEVQTDLSRWDFADGLSPIVPHDATNAELDFGTWNTELTRANVMVRSVRGTQVSAFSEPIACVLPIHPPEELIAVVEADGVRLSWRNLSQLATSFLIERSELDATGNPGAWSFSVNKPAARNTFDVAHLDPTVERGKAYAFRVTSTEGEHNSPAPGATTVVIGQPLRTTTLRIPLAASMVTDGRGHYAYATSPAGAPSGTVRIFWGDGVTWTSVDVPATPDALGPQFYPPGMKLDAAGLPHAVYGKPLGAGTGVRVTHGFSDGTQWREEVIADRQLYDSGMSPLFFDLDASGTPVMAWSVRSRRLEAATKDAGAWTVTSLDSVYPDVSGLSTFAVFADQAGTLHVLVAASAAILHLQPRNGVWTSERLPVPPVNISLYDPLVGVGPDADHLAVFFEVPAAAQGSARVTCLRKGPLGWGAVESLGTLPFVGSSSSYQAVLSPNGSRLALLAKRGADAPHVLRSDDGSPWTETIVSPLQFFSPGFDANGKLFVLSMSSPAAGDVVVGDAQLDIEP